MKLFDAILDANHRAVAGDGSAGLHVADYASELPVVALTCIDPRLNPLFPGVLALPAEHFIWLRNAGNIIVDPFGDTMRSIALACAIKGGKEITVIGHTDCKVGQTTASWLTDRFKSLGVDRRQLPENITDYFCLFASERANVIRGVEIIRKSPLIGPDITVQGLLVDTQTGKLEWVVNGYQAMDERGGGGHAINLPAVGASLGAFEVGEMKFPEAKIGEIGVQAASEVPRDIPKAPPPGTRTRPLPVPPPIRMRKG
jgi:carbonic anhydrase